MIVLNQKAIDWSSFRVANTKVHIWHASLQQPVEVVQKLEAVLCEEERGRAERFRLQEHRQSFIVSRGILRNLLSRYTGLQPEEIQFKYNLAGKPFLANQEAVPEICFNLTHAGQLVLYAFSEGSRWASMSKSSGICRKWIKLSKRIFRPQNIKSFKR